MEQVDESEASDDSSIGSKTQKGKRSVGAAFGDDDASNASGLSRKTRGHPSA